MVDGARMAAHRSASALVIGLFFLWGAANNLNDVLMAHFRSAFVLGDFGSSLVQSAFYLGYFCMALPAAAFMQRFGYRAGVVLGLVLFASGATLFWPASAVPSYAFFLIALFVIASGLAFLETAANPMVVSMGPPDEAERRLNFAQAFNPLGSITGVTIGALMILPAQGGSSDIAAVRLPYLLIAAVVLLWAVLIARARLPGIAGDERGSDDRDAGGYAELLRRPRYMAGVAAQFCYVGAQVGIWSFLIRYTLVAMPQLGQRDAAWLLTGSLVLFMVGRFAGTALLARVSGARLMFVFAAVDVALCAIAAWSGTIVGVVALVTASFFMSIMYPTIFVLSLRGLGPLVKRGASMIVMAIIGGAAITAVMGLLSDIGGAIRLAMLAPAACFLVVALFARMHLAR